MPIGSTALEAFVGTRADFDAYVERMEGREWGDHLVLLAIGSLHSADVKVWSSAPSADLPTVYRPLGPEVMVTRTLSLGHYHEYHWLSAEPRRGADPPAAHEAQRPPAPEVQRGETEQQEKMKALQAENEQLKQH
eukprot:gene5007-5600_t